MPKCKVCKIKFITKYMGQKCCCYEHEIIYFQKNQVEMKEREIANKTQFKKDKAQIRERAKRLSYYKNKAWDLFSIYVRKSYADSNGMVSCYTCGNVMRWQDSQCGHAIGGRHGAVLFDEDICRPQCVTCNLTKRGNYTLFTTKLINENGINWWNTKIEESKGEIKRGKSEYLELIEQYREKQCIVDG